MNKIDTHNNKGGEERSAATSLLRLGTRLKLSRQTLSLIHI